MGINISVIPLKYLRNSSGPGLDISIISTQYLRLQTPVLTYYDPNAKGRTFDMFYEYC